MANTSGRTLELLNLLQRQRYWHGPDLADRLEVSTRTLRRDVDRLRDLGYPIDSVPGVEGGYQMAAGQNLPPMVFTDTEAVALAVGLRLVSQGPDEAAAEASVRALAKLTAVLPLTVRRRVELIQQVTDGPAGGGWAHEQPSFEVLGVVAQACADAVRLRFRYRTRGDGVASGDVVEGSDGTERYVEPYRLVTRRQRWYLVAFDIDRDDWRTFRLDRIAASTAARTQFDPRPLPADDLYRYLDERIRDLRPLDWSSTEQPQPIKR